MKTLLTVLLISISGFVLAQVTFHVNDLPANTPANTDIFISGDFDGWTGGDDNYKLTQQEDGTYAITLAQQSGSINYKFTRGSWGTVEKGAQGEEISNRVYAFGGNGDTVDITILSWADAGEGTSTATHNVSVLADAFEMPQLDGRTRKIWIYIPPDYESSDLSYPVLYMHDGQNLFDDSTAFAGEWHVDETLNDLFDEINMALIVIGIENGGGERINEYSPWENPSFGGGEGKNYIDFIVETLKPYVDQNYRTLKDQSNTGLMGSSLGGLISHYGGLAAPEVFGKTGVFSPSFWFSDSAYIFGHSNSNIDNAKMYFLAGGMESTQIDVPANTAAMIDTMVAGGFEPNDLALQIDPSGTHSEAFWSEEFGEAIKWLFGDSTVSAEVVKYSRSDLKVKIFPNPVHDTLHVDLPDSHTSYRMELFNSSGRKVFDRYITGRNDIDVSGYGGGIFMLKISQGNAYHISKLIVH